MVFQTACRIFLFYELTRTEITNQLPQSLSSLPRLIHRNSLRKAIINTLRQPLRNGLQVRRHLCHHRRRKVPRRILLQLQIQQNHGIHHQQLIKLWFRRHNRGDGLVDARGEVHRRGGHVERLREGEVGGLVGRLGAVVDGGEELGGLDGDFEEREGVAVPGRDGGVEGGCVGGDCVDGCEDGVWVWGWGGEEGGEEGEEGDEAELHFGGLLDYIRVLMELLLMVMYIRGKLVVVLI